MALVFRELLRRFRRLCGEQAAREGASGGGVPAKLCGADAQDEAEEVSGVAGENGVGLCACDLRRAGDFGDPAEVVPEIGVEWAEGLVDRERHGRKEFYAVGLSLRAQAHHAIKEAIGALAR